MHTFAYGEKDYWAIPFNNDTPPLMTEFFAYPGTNFLS